MSLSENLNGCITLTAGADLSTKQYYAVKINTSGLVVLAGAGEAAIGILYTKPSASGAVCSVKRLEGKCQGIAAGVIAPGAFLASDASGKLTTATKASVDTSDTGAGADPVVGSHVIGIYNGTANSAANDIIQFIGMPLGAVPTTAA